MNATAGSASPTTGANDKVAESVVTVFEDYTSWALARSTHLKSRRPPVGKSAAMMLVVSEASPSVFADLADVVLLRPAVLKTLPPFKVIELTTRARALVISAHGSEPFPTPRRTGRPMLWQRLAEFIARSGRPVNALLDLGGRGGGEAMVRRDIEFFHRTYARHSAGAIAVSYKRTSPLDG